MALENTGDVSIALSSSPISPSSLSSAAWTSSSSQHKHHQHPPAPPAPPASLSSSSTNQHHQHHQHQSAVLRHTPLSVIGTDTYISGSGCNQHHSINQQQQHTAHPGGSVITSYQHLPLYQQVPQHKVCLELSAAIRRMFYFELVSQLSPGQPSASHNERSRKPQ